MAIYLYISKSSTKFGGKQTANKIKHGKPIESSCGASRSERGELCGK